jgi:hypothetical protein
MAETDWAHKFASGELKSTILPMSKPFVSANLFLAVICLYGALSAISTNPVEGWLGSALMTFFVVMCLIVLFKGAYLELSDEGLTKVFPPGKQVIRWADMKSVKAGFIGVELQIEFNKTVTLEFLDKSGRMTRLRLFARGYKMSADELASLISFYWDRARTISRPAQKQGGLSSDQAEA